MLDNSAIIFDNVVNRLSNVRGMEFSASLILGPIVGAFLTLLYQKIKNILCLFPNRRILKSLIDKDNKISIAIACIGLEDFDLIKKKGTARLPKNVNLISVYDALGAAYLQDRLTELYKNIDVKIYSSGTFPSYDQNIFTIGGSSVNNITYTLMEDRKIDERFRMVYPDHYAVDHINGKEIRFDARIRDVDECIVEDYGFIIMGRSPFNPKKKVCVLAGLWPYGTYGAIYSIVNPKNVGLYKEWKKLRSKKDGFFAAIKVSVGGETPSVPSILYVREIDARDQVVYSTSAQEKANETINYPYDQIIFP